MVGEVAKLFGAAGTLSEQLDALGKADFEARAGEDREVRQKLAKASSVGEKIAILFEALCEPMLPKEKPCFVVDFPLEVSPLARKRDAEPRLVDRFEAYAGGMEIANAFSELNDPRDQEERFRAQVARAAQGDHEAMPYDRDFVRALEHGMPPTAGEGIGIDRLAMLFTDAATIREVILFPLLKTEAEAPEKAAGTAKGEEPG
jgi:lysyl-tRNA synthetase class 2